MNLAKQLFQVRIEYGLSLPEAAKQIGIPKSALSKLENGVNLNPCVNTLEKLARFYRIRFIIK